MFGSMTGSQAWSNPRVLLALLIALGLLATQAGRGTLAYFTSAATSGGNQFTGGTLTLSPSTGVGAIVTLTATGNAAFKPSVTQYGQTTLSLGVNDVDAQIAADISRAALSYGANGSAPLTSAVDWDNALTWSVYKRINVAGTCDGAGTGVGNATNWTGLTLAATPFHVTELEASTAFQSLFPKSAATAVTGASNLILCFVLNWPLGTAPASNTTGDNEFQGQSHTYNIRLTAEQA